MDVNTETTQSMFRLFLDTLRLDPDITARGMREYVGRELDFLAPVLPEPEEWDVVSEERGVGVLRLLGGQSILTVRLDVRQLEEGSAAPNVGSVGLDPSRSRIELTVGAPTSDREGRWGKTTDWSFRREEEEFLRITGFISDDGSEPDRSELLARAIAAKLGW